jgi:hypothetical protein
VTLDRVIDVTFRTPFRSDMSNRLTDSSSSDHRVAKVLPYFWAQRNVSTGFFSGLLAFVVFISRIGFLYPGYGTDPDAHRLAVAAYQIRQSGHYIMSREPGHPVQEVLCSLACSWGPIGINALTALMSSLGVLFFTLVLRRLKVSCPWVIAMALGFSPLYYVHSVDAMDYVWALAFTWVSVYCALRGFVVAAGVALGLAIGCRVTEALSYFPIVLLLGLGGNKVTSKYSWLKLGLIATAVAALAYGLVFFRFGWSVLRVYDETRVSGEVILARLFVEPWGTLGLVAVCSLSVSGIVRYTLPTWFAKRSTSTSTSEPRVVVAAALAVLLTVGVFLRLPHDSGYLLPIVPWVLLGLALLVPRRQIVLASVAVVLGSVPLPGGWQSPVWVAHQTRQAQVASVRELIVTLRAVRQRAVLVAGTYQPKILSALVTEPLPQIDVRYLLNGAEAEQLRLQGIKVFYLRRAMTLNRSVTGLDLRQSGGAPL